MDRKNLYEIMHQISQENKPAWHSFLADVQGEIITEIDAVIGTEKLNNIMKRVVSQRVVL